MYENFDCRGVLKITFQNVDDTSSGLTLYELAVTLEHSQSRSQKRVT